MASMGEVARKWVPAADSAEKGARQLLSEMPIYIYIYTHINNHMYISVIMFTSMRLHFVAIPSTFRKGGCSGNRVW